LTEQEQSQVADVSRIYFRKNENGRTNPVSRLLISGMMRQSAPVFALRKSLSYKQLIHMGFKIVYPT